MCAFSLPYLYLFIVARVKGKSSSRENKSLVYMNLHSTVAQKCHGNFNLFTAISIYSWQFQFTHGNFNYCLTVPVPVPVPYCTASQNASISVPHINSSIEATSKSYLLMLLVAVFLFLLKKKQKLWSHTKEHAIYGPSLRFVFCFLTEMKSDRSELIFRLVNA